MKIVLNHAYLGDFLNTSLLVVALVYQLFTYGHFKNWSGWELASFGENWARDGFCLSFKGTLYHTHLLCLYGDLILASLLYLISRHEKRRELALVSQSCASIIGHGFAHGFLWYQGDIDVNKLRKGETGDLLSVLHILGAALFFLGFLELVSSGPIWLKALQSLVHGVVLTHFCPLILAFSYVNTVIFTNSSIMQLLHGLEGQKDCYYSLFALLVSTPIMVAAIVEPLTCDSFLVHYGGHILFDYSIPIVTLVYFLVARSLEPRSSKKKAE